MVWNSLWWLSSDWPDWIKDKIFGGLEGVASIFADILIGVSPSFIVLIFFLGYFMNWSLGHLTLTNRALYFRGWFVSKHIPLDGIHEVRDRMRAVLVKLPPDEDQKFRVGGCHTRWLTRVMRIPADERWRETGLLSPTWEAAEDGLPSTF